MTGTFPAIIIAGNVPGKKIKKRDLKNLTFCFKMENGVNSDFLKLNQ